MSTKPIKKSKTIWVSVTISILGAIITGMPMIQESIPKDIYGFTLMILGVVFAVLRSVTNSALVMKERGNRDE